MLPEERFKKALFLFIEQNAHAAAAIKQLSPQVAEHLGVTFEQYKFESASKLFAEHAQAMGRDVSLLVFELTATTDAELHQLKSTYYRSLASALGMSWAEYTSENPHLSRY